MDLLNKFLQVSASLFEHLTDIPHGVDRTEFLEEINRLLDERGEIIEQLKKEGFVYDGNNQSHVTLFELDKGIRERLTVVDELVKKDIKNLNNAKKHEIQYINPYGSLRNLDGRYFDGKK